MFLFSSNTLNYRLRYHLLVISYCILYNDLWTKEENVYIFLPWLSISICCISCLSCVGDLTSLENFIRKLGTGKLTFIQSLFAGLIGEGYTLTSLRKMKPRNFRVEQLTSIQKFVFRTLKRRWKIDFTQNKQKDFGLRLQPNKFAQATWRIKTSPNLRSLKDSRQEHSSSRARRHLWRKWLRRLTKGHEDWTLEDEKTTSPL